MTQLFKTRPSQTEASRRILSTTEHQIQVADEFRRANLDRILGMRNVLQSACTIQYIQRFPEIHDRLSPCYVRLLSRSSLSLPPAMLR
jgi:hypothetical protein